MSNVAVVYFSSTGNTEAMANGVAEGLKAAGAETTLFTSDKFDQAKVADFDAIAFGCSAMGDEELEETEFRPMFDDCVPALSGKKLALFGSYGWGDGEWMRSWEEECKKAGAVLACDSVIANEMPGDEELEQCRKLGAALA